MAIEDSLQKIELKQISKTPFAYALYVITGVLVSVVFFQRADFNTQLSVKDRRIDELTLQVKQERKTKDDVFTAYLVEKMANDMVKKTSR